MKYVFHSAKRENKNMTSLSFIFLAHGWIWLVNNKFGFTIQRWKYLKEYWKTGFHDGTWMCQIPKAIFQSSLSRTDFWGDVNSWTTQGYLSFSIFISRFLSKRLNFWKKKKKTLLHQKASERACYSICFISSQGSKTAFSRGIILKYYCIHQVKMMSQRKLSLTRSLFDSLFDKPTFLGQRGLNMLNSSIFPCSSVAMSRIFWHWVVCAQMIG